MTEDNASVNGLLPMKPVVLQILLALGERDLHGYGVMQAVGERSEGRIRLETGPFYRHLRKLLELRLVAESEERPDDDDARRGAYYRLTARGRVAVAAETERLAGVVALSAELGLRDQGGDR